MGKRVYLSRDKRRNMLMDVAAELVEQQGWSALTMVSLATQADVSRQLVYQHFSSTEQLMAATLTHLFKDVYDNTREAVLQERPRGLAQTIQLMQRITLDIPAGRARALWQAMSASGSGEGEISALSSHLRHLLVKLTRPLVQQALALNATQAETLVWMLIVSFWGARQLLDEGEITQQELMQMHGWVTERVIRGTDAKAPVIGE